MAGKLLLVDFENVHQVDLSKLDHTFSVIIFVGASQKNIPIELVTNAQRLGDRLEWQRVEGNGSNALDFFIACHLGQVLLKSPNLHCYILSKDKGFDPLLKHLNKVGLKCKRLNSLLELEPKLEPSSTENPNYKRVIELLTKSDKKARPRRRKTLNQHILAMFQKNISQVEIDQIVDIMFAKRLISETKNVLSYEF